MWEFLGKLFASDFMPHGYCYLWKPEIVWLHAGSDATITLSYYLIPVALAYFVRKRRDLPFHWMFLMFGIFIFGCGTTHLMEIWTLWHGTYRLAGMIKAITAAASVCTAALLVPLLPRALALPSPSQLRAINVELEGEIGERRRAEQALQKAHAQLELRVQQRTAELAASNLLLEAEIAERKRAEEVLRKQASLLELAHDAIIVRDMSDNIAYWNVGAEETYGWNRRDALGKVAQEFLGSVYPPEMDLLKAEVVLKGRWAGELVQTRRDGKRITVSSRWALQRDDDGNPAAIFQINTDITERKQAEERLRRSEEFLSEGQRLSHTGSWGWRVSSGELEFSQETFHIFGFDPTGPTPSFQDAIERIHPDDRTSVQRILDAAIREKSDYEVEARLALPDGSIRYVHSVGRAVISESGGLEFVGTLRDVTDRVRADQSVQATQAELAHMARVTTMGEMVASIAHEVNQPLAAVVTNGNAALRWLHAAVPNLEEARTAIQRIVKEGNRASDVIGRIRALLKKKKPQMSALSINELIREVLTLARHEIQRREVSLRTELAEDLPVITGDPVQLQQVVLNLVLNAIEAASAKSEGPREVLLTSRHPEENGIVVAIHDSGPGIDPKDIDQLFKPFFTTKATGIGMGLSISRSMIESHGGRLWAEPRSGPGATFEFSLPAAGAAPLPAVGAA